MTGAALVEVIEGRIHVLHGEGFRHRGNVVAGAEIEHGGHGGR